MGKTMNNKGNGTSCALTYFVPTTKTKARRGSAALRAYPDLETYIERCRRGKTDRKSIVRVGGYNQ